MHLNLGDHGNKINQGKSNYVDGEVAKKKTCLENVVSFLS
jgi:hypothetical protein